MPKQKVYIIKAELRGVAEARARDWAIRVNPQGRKKVNIPAITGETDLILKFLNENIFKKFRAKIKVIMETIKLVIPIF